MDLEDITAAILAGGLGTRLSSAIKRKQKVLATVKNYPFLKYILDKLQKTGIKKVIICTGHLGEQVKKEFGNTYGNLSIYYSQENSKLDTAGAIRLALPFIKTEDILVTNGDSYLDFDLKKFWQFHLQKKSKASILLTRVSNLDRYGQVVLDKNNKITSFQEKHGKVGTGLINSGIYLFKKPLLLKIPKNKAVSFEKELFPTLIGKDFYGFEAKGKFIDIGTPKSYQEAQSFFGSI
ncbi:MAG: nucleotidyltransferase family protein [Candidatus Levyibacteriota bacterium]|nr:MAG: nucleotidyltransferase family protein [Candidatus Levybacteria bacterium]